MVTDAVGGRTTDGDQSKRMAEGPQETAWPTPLLIIGSSRAGCSGLCPIRSWISQDGDPTASLGNHFPCLRSLQLALEEKPWHCCCGHVVPRSLAGSEFVGADEAGPAPGWGEEFPAHSTSLSASS